MGRPRNTEVELCFDSMTDLITNLAGGLILVVLLLMGVTRETPETAEPRPAAAPGRPTDAEKSVRPLRERINRLTGEVAAADREITLYDQQLPLLKQEIDALLKKAGAPSASPTVD